MKLYLILFFVVLHEMAHGWYAMDYFNPMKESGKGCKSVDPEVGEMELGEFKELEDCVQAVCGENGILYLGCDDVAASQNCTVLEGNITMPYPHCCSTCKEQHTQ